MVKPLQATYSKTHPFVIERHDQDDGTISYEIWDYRPGKYRRLCTIYDDLDGGLMDDQDHLRSTAHADAEMIVRALNLMSGGLPE